MRKTVKADGRFAWDEIFFKDNFEKVLSKEDAGDYKFPLEMLRLAPSAVNKQPWRVVVTENAVHFFEKHSVKVDVGSVDMQRIDVGIGICHFHLAVQEQDMEGHFERVVPKFAVPKDMSYIVSWVRD